MPTDEQDGTTSSDTLHGWKDIGNYLGRSPRAAQRWERELGLPVHRIKGADGQAVFALKSEIDDWKTSRAVDAPAPNPADDPLPDHAPSGWTLKILGHRLSAMVVIAIAVTLLAVGMGLGAYALTPRLGVAVSVHAGGTKVVAFDAAGHEVWSHDMGHMVGQLTARSLVPSGGQEPIRRLGKNGPALVALETTLGNQRVGAEQTLVAFESDGRIRWQFSPADTLTCGSETFGPPWMISSVIVSTRGPRPTAWVSVTHHTWWTSQVFEIDENGHATLRYRQAGWIWALAEWEVAGKRLLGIGGVLNEFEKASLTLIDMDGAPATAPHADPRFGCEGSPAGLPARVYLFPVMDVRVLGPYALTSGIRVFGDMMQAHTDESGGGSVLEINSELQPSSFSLPDGYWVVHRSLEAKGLLTHPAEACPELRRAHIIDEWSAAAGWTHVTMPPNGRVGPTLKKH